jgi:uncharacterized cupin superfamily protein
MSGFRKNTFTELRRYASITTFAVFGAASTLTACAHAPNVAAANVSAGHLAAPSSARPFRLSGTAEGAIQVDRDERSASFVYHSAPTGSEVGVWQGRGRAKKPGAAAVLNREDYTELMFILEGGVVLAEPNGPEISLTKGDAVIVPRGVPYYWRLPEGQWVKKVDVILDQAKGGPPLAYAHILKMDASGPPGIGLDEVEGVAAGHTYYEVPQGGSAGVWKTGPYVGGAAFAPKSYSEVMIFLRGEGELLQKDKSTIAFHAGDVVFVPKGASYQWRSKDVQKFWVMFDETPSKTE